MKKLLYLFYALIMAVFCISCNNSDDALVCSIECEIEGYVYNVSEETKQKAENLSDALNNRLTQIFGKTFNINDEGKRIIPENTLNSIKKRIVNDSKMQDYASQLQQLKTLDGDPAITKVKFYIISGTVLVTQFNYTFD